MILYNLVVATGHIRGKVGGLGLELWKLPSASASLAWKVYEDIERVGGEQAGFRFHYHCFKHPNSMSNPRTKTKTITRRSSPPLSLIPPARGQGGHRQLWLRLLEPTDNIYKSAAYILILVHAQSNPSPVPVQSFF